MIEWSKLRKKDMSRELSKNIYDNLSFYVDLILEAKKRMQSEFHLNSFIVLAASYPYLRYLVFYGRDQRTQIENENIIEKLFEEGESIFS